MENTISNVHCGLHLFLLFHNTPCLDTKRPLFTSFQEEQKIVPLPANCPSIAVMDVAENIRAKIYAVLDKLGKKALTLTRVCM